jgi:chromosome segregation ATPase
MRPRQPATPPESEADLFEQWAVLDRLVERQAAQLRAGIQDAEDVDDPAASVAGSPAQQAELEHLRGELRQLEAARHAAEAARRAAEAATRRAVDAERLWQGRAVATEHDLQAARAGAEREITSLRLRLEEAEAALRRAEISHAEMIEALRSAHLEVETLRRQDAERRGFWHLGHH